MHIQYYGTRGSLPTPGKTTVKYGGNTTCLSIESNDRHIIVDGGSGLRLLGLDLMKKEFARGQGQAVFFWSHFHWDHIMGFPFFLPNFIPGNQFTHYGPPAAREVLVRQQDFINFPVAFDKMPSQHSFNSLPESGPVAIHGLQITSCRMNHPAGGRTYRFDDGRKSLVFATDIEHFEDKLDPELLQLAQDAELLIYDAQYTPDEYQQGRKGWGHSTWEKGVELAKAANVKRLHLWHHDQLHSDAFLETKILQPARRQFPRTFLAREGWSFEL